MTYANENSPSSVVINYVFAAHTNNAELFVRSIRTVDYRIMIVLFGEEEGVRFFMRRGTRAFLQDSPITDPDEIIIVSENIQGNTATVFIKDNPQPINLIKEEGEWRVNLELCDAVRSILQ